MAFENIHHVLILKKIRITSVIKLIKDVACVKYMKKI